MAEKVGLRTREAEYKLRDYLAVDIPGFPKLCGQCISEIDWVRVVGYSPDLPLR